MDLEKAYDLLGIYAESLVNEELSELTVKKYIRDITRFLDYVGGAYICKNDLLDYKKYLQNKYKVSTVNSYLISVNRYLNWLGIPYMTVKVERIQRSFNPDALSRAEYEKLLLRCREKANDKYYMLIRTLACTGIRVNELKYITVDAAACGIAAIRSKGKNREIYIPPRLSRELIDYCRKTGVTNGIIFTGRYKGSPLRPSSVWKLLKRVAMEAGVAPEKVYPHCFRRLFARTYMQRIGNLFELADLLGHSSIETTRIYAFTSRGEKLLALDALNL